jgi:hypothetical protein
MIVSRLGFLALIASLAISGCAGNHPLTAVSIVALADTVPLHTDQILTVLETSVRLHNAGARIVYIGGCGPDAEKQIASHWVTVWTPVCGGGPWRPLGPGESVTVPVRIAAFTNGNGYPRLDPRFTPGVFRLVFRVADVPVPGPSDKARFCASSNFVVKGATP